MIDDAPFDAEALYEMITTDDNADTYRRVLEQAVAFQRKHHDSDRWNDYEWAGFEVGDVGAAGWELEQLRRTGVITKTMSTNSTTQYRLGEQDEEWTLYHEQAERVLEAAASGTEPGEAERDGGVSGSLDDVDVDELFTDVVGYEKEKKWFRRTLREQEQVHHLLVGEPGSGKSMMLADIVENVPGARRVVFTGNQTTAQGINDILTAEEPPVLVVEEIEKGDREDREALMTLCGQGYIQETKGDGRKGKKIDLDTIVFAAGNQPEKITPESLVDRFMTWPFEQYTREEFETVCRGVLPREKDVDPDLAEYIATQMFAQHGSTSVRDARDIAGLAESEDEVRELVDLILS